MTWQRRPGPLVPDLPSRAGLTRVPLPRRQNRCFHTLPHYRCRRVLRGLFILTLAPRPIAAMPLPPRGGRLGRRLLRPAQDTMAHACLGLARILWPGPGRALLIKIEASRRPVLPRLPCRHACVDRPRGHRGPLSRRRRAPQCVCAPPLILTAAMLPTWRLNGVVFYPRCFQNCW